MAAARKRNAVDPPLVIFPHLPVSSFFDVFGRHVRLTGFERMSEQAYNLVGIVLGPQDPNNLVEITPDEAGNIPEHRQCRGIDGLNLEVGIAKYTPSGALFKSVSNWVVRRRRASSLARRSRAASLLTRASVRFALTCATSSRAENGLVR
jgi:hypothetical protein